MTKDTIGKMGNAIAVFSDPFERAFNEVVAEPIWRPSRSSGDPPEAIRDALMVEFDVRGRKILRDYHAALASDADPYASFMQCARALAAVFDVNTGMDCDRDYCFTFGKLQYVINKADILAYVDCFWDHVGSRVAEIDGKRLEDWFLAPDSPRQRFKYYHCLMNDETTERAVRECRECGENRAIPEGLWGDVSWRSLCFVETGDRYSVAWYHKFQAMAAELAGRLGLYPIEFLFCRLLSRPRLDRFAVPGGGRR